MNLEEIDLNASWHRGYKIAVQRIRPLPSGASYEAKALELSAPSFHAKHYGFAWGKTKEEAIEMCKQQLDNHLDSSAQT